MLSEGRWPHVSAISQFVPVQRLNEVLLEPADCSLGDDPAGVIVYSEEERVCFALVVHGLLRVYIQASDGREVAIRYAFAECLIATTVRGTATLLGGPAPVFVQAW